MYQEHALRISDWAHDSPENLRDLITFVLLTIRVQFHRVESSMKETRKLGDASPHLWGWKRAGHAYVRDNAAELHADLFDADTIGFIDTLATRVPGLGIVKSAFVAQMFGHEAACIDARNMIALGIEGRPWRTDGQQFARMSMGARYAKIGKYLAQCEAFGGAAHLWDTWCSGIAPEMGMLPDEVSALHWKIPTGRRL